MKLKLYFQNRKGRVSRSDLRNILEKFQIRLQDRHFKQLMEKIDPQHTNSISYQKFLDLFEETDTQVSSAMASGWSRTLVLSLLDKCHQGYISYSINICSCVKSLFYLF